MSSVVTHTLWGAPCGMDYTTDGRFLLASEDTGIVRIFKTGIENRQLDPTQITCELPLEIPLVLACNLNHVVIGSGNSVILFELPLGNFKETLTRHSLFVGAIAYSRDGVFVASGSDDHSIRLTNIENPKDSFELGKHNAPIASIDFDPLCQFLASVGNDGRVIIWDISKKTIIQNIEVCKRIRDPRSKEVTKIRWSPKGNYIAFQGMGSDIIIMQRSNFAIVKSFIKHKSVVTSLEWSPEGKRIVSSSVDSQIIIWDVESQQILYENNLATFATCIRWHPTQNTISLTLQNQTLLTFDNLSEVIVKKIETKSSEIFNEDLILEDNLEKMDLSDNESKHETNDEQNDSDLDDFVVDDNDEDGLGLSRKQKMVKLKTNLLNAGFTSTTPLQKSFQPGSSPKIGEKAYLSFNIFGVIFSIDQGSVVSYHIEFHDKSIYRPIQFTDARIFNIAALSKTAAVFACCSEESLLAAIHCRIFNAWSAKNTWSITLEKDEEPIGIAIGNSSIIVVSNSNLIRIFSIGGVQTDCFTLGNPFVTINALEDCCMIVSHYSAPFNEDQQLDAIIYDFDRKRIKSQSKLHISHKSKLSWIGFSNLKVPLSLDSKGILRAASNSPTLWTPVIDLTKLKDTPQNDIFNYFAVGMLEKTFLTVLCRGSKYPGFPRHALTELECVIPSLGCSPMENQWETERFFAHALLENSNKFLLSDENSHFIDNIESQRKKVDKLALQLIQTCCKAGNLQKALDYTEILEFDRSLEMSSRIAEYHQLPGLKDRISRLIMKRISIIEKNNSSFNNNEKIEEKEDYSSKIECERNSLFSSDNKIENNEQIDIPNINPIVSAATKRNLKSQSEISSSSSLSSLMANKKPKFNPFLKSTITNPFLDNKTKSEETEE